MEWLKILLVWRSMFKWLSRLDCGLWCLLKLKVRWPNYSMVWEESTSIEFRIRFLVFYGFGSYKDNLTFSNFENLSLISWAGLLTTDKITCLLSLGYSKVVRLWWYLFLDFLELAYIEGWSMTELCLSFLKETLGI